MQQSSRIASFGWLLTVLVLILAITSWGQSFGWHFGSLNVYVLFPVFGLIAFSTMWSQYMTGALSQYLGGGPGLQTYFKVTGFIVLAAILIHPGLLTWQLWRDGLGLPPGSELNYVMPSLRVAIVIGMTALLIFLAYEFRHVFAKRRWWRFVNYLVDIATVGIFYHSLRLGTQTQAGWFHALWWFYGLSLILALGYKYASKIPRETRVTKKV
jgi:hypothetical protein